MILYGCLPLTANEMRKQGPGCVFTSAEGIPKEFVLCLADELDENLGYGTSIIRDRTDGNIVLFYQLNLGIIHYIFDIKKIGKGMEIPFYNQSGVPCEQIMAFPLFEKSLNACGATIVN